MWRTTACSECDGAEDGAGADEAGGLLLDPDDELLLEFDEEFELEEEELEDEEEPDEPDPEDELDPDEEPECEDDPDPPPEAGRRRSGAVVRAMLRRARAASVARGACIGIAAMPISAAIMLWWRVMSIRRICFWWIWVALDVS